MAGLCQGQRSSLGRKRNWFARIPAFSTQAQKLHDRIAGPPHLFGLQVLHVQPNLARNKFSAEYTCLCCPSWAASQRVEYTGRVPEHAWLPDDDDLPTRFRQPFFRLGGLNLPTVRGHACPAVADPRLVKFVGHACMLHHHVLLW